MQPAELMKICPLCRTPVPLAAVVCSRCGREFRTQFTQPPPSSQSPAAPAPDTSSRPSPSQAASPYSQPISAAQAAPLPVPSVTPAVPTVPLIIPCVVCGNADIQKVSAIWHSGTWASTGTSIGVGHTHFSGGGNANTVGVSTSRQQGASSIASILAPPEMPKLRTSHDKELGWGCMLPFGVFCLLLASGFASSGGIGTAIGFGIVGIAVAANGIGAILDGRRKQAVLQEERSALAERHKQAEQIWETLLYCPRCDSVYQPQSGQSVPSRQMRQLTGF